MGKKRILIVDDEETVLTILKSSLHALGSDYQVTTATNGKDALEQIRKGTFDLIVTDYLMPEMDGLELTAAARAIQPDTRVVMITAYGSTQIEVEAHRLRVYRYLNKPLDITAFRQVIRDALNAPPFEVMGGAAFSEETYQEINRCLDDLLLETSSRCVFLGDCSGSVVARAGELNESHISTFLAFLRGSVANAVEAHRVLNSSADATHLVFVAGDQRNLFILNIGLHLLLVLIVNREDSTDRLGTIWYFARQTAQALRKALNAIE